MIALLFPKPARELPENIVTCLITLIYKVANIEDILWGSLKLIFGLGV